jgi:hypothetical protein
MHSESSSKTAFAVMNMLVIPFCFPLISSMVRSFKFTDPCSVDFHAMAS